MIEYRMLTEIVYNCLLEKKREPREDLNEIIANQKALYVLAAEDGYSACFTVVEHEREDGADTGVLLLREGDDQILWLVVYREADGKFYLSGLFEYYGDWDTFNAIMMNMKLKYGFDPRTHESSERKAERVLADLMNDAFGRA